LSTLSQREPSAAFAAFLSAVRILLHCGSSFLFLFVTVSLFYFSIYYCLPACLHSLTPHGTSLTIISYPLPPSINQSINHQSTQYSHDLLLPDRYANWPWPNPVFLMGMDTGAAAMMVPPPPPPLPLPPHPMTMMSQQQDVAMSDITSASSGSGGSDSGSGSGGSQSQASASASAVVAAAHRTISISPPPVTLQEATAVAIATHAEIVEGVSRVCPVWDPAANVKDKAHVLPIVTPAYPAMNSAYNIGLAQARMISDELHRGLRFFASRAATDPSAEKPFPFHNLLQPVAPEFFGRYTRYLQVDIWALTEDEKRLWFGWAESRLRTLIAALDQPPALVAYPMSNVLHHNELSDLTVTTSSSSTSSGSGGSRSAGAEEVKEATTAAVVQTPPSSPVKAGGGSSDQAFSTNATADDKSRAAYNNISTKTLPAVSTFFIGVGIGTYYVLPSLLVSWWSLCLSYPSIAACLPAFYDTT
jgi:hypothetical protein